MSRFPTNYWEQDDSEPEYVCEYCGEELYEPVVHSGRWGRRIYAHQECSVLRQERARESMDKAWPKRSA